MDVVCCRSATRWLGSKSDVNAVEDGAKGEEGVYGHGLEGTGVIGAL